MNIEELKDNHWKIGIKSYHFSTPSQEHTKLSVEFAISVLESLKYKEYWAETEFLNLKLEDKIQELKQYLEK